MAGNLQQRLDSIRSKALVLTQRHQQLMQRQAQAEAQIETLRSQLAKSEQLIARQRQQIEQLQVVTTITPSREAVERSRAFLSGLMRDIDKCIAELTD